MKTIKQFLLSVLILIGGTSYAQDPQNLFEEFLFSGEKDANKLLGEYMLPAMKGLGYGVNSGWYTTAKPHETFGFDITLSYVNAIVPVSDQSFEFVQSDYDLTYLQGGGSTSLPTLMGGPTSAILEVSPDGGQTILTPYNAPDGVAETINKATITSETAVPTPIIQVGFGIIKGTEIKIRWLPNINRDGFAFNYFGLGAMHSISQWLPVFKDIPVDISAFIGWTTISAEYAIPANPIMDMTNPRATADINTFTYQLIASAHVSVLTGYVALGYDNFNTNFKMLGTYDVYPGALEPLVDPIDLDQSGNSGFRTSFGGRLKLSIITLTADYTLREYNTLTLSLGFSVR